MNNITHSVRASFCLDLMSVATVAVSRLREEHPITYGLPKQNGEFKI